MNKIFRMAAVGVVAIVGGAEGQKATRRAKCQL